MQKTRRGWEKSNAWVVCTEIPLQLEKKQPLRCEYRKRAAPEREAIQGQMVAIII